MKLVKKDLVKFLDDKSSLIPLLLKDGWEVEEVKEVEKKPKKKKVEDGDGEEHS